MLCCCKKSAIVELISPTALPKPLLSFMIVKKPRLSHIHWQCIVYTVYVIEFQNLHNLVPFMYSLIGRRVGLFESPILSRFLKIRWENRGSDTSIAHYSIWAWLWNSCPESKSNAFIGSVNQSNWLQNAQNSLGDRNLAPSLNNYKL